MKIIILFFLVGSAFCVPVHYSEGSLDYGPTTYHRHIRSRVRSESDSDIAEGDGSIYENGSDRVTENGGESSVPGLNILNEGLGSVIGSGGLGAITKNLPVVNKAKSVLSTGVSGLTSKAKKSAQSGLNIVNEGLGSVIGSGGLGDITEGLPVVNKAKSVLSTGVSALTSKAKEGAQSGLNIVNEGLGSVIGSGGLGDITENLPVVNKAKSVLSTGVSGLTSKAKESAQSGLNIVNEGLGGAIENGGLGTISDLPVVNKAKSVLSTGVSGLTSKAKNSAQSGLNIGNEVLGSVIENGGSGDITENLPVVNKAKSVLKTGVSGLISKAAGVTGDRSGIDSLQEDVSADGSGVDELESRSVAGNQVLDSGSGNQYNYNVKYSEDESYNDNEETDDNSESFYPDMQ